VLWAQQKSGYDFPGIAPSYSPIVLPGAIDGENGTGDGENNPVLWIQLIFMVIYAADQEYGRATVFNSSL
jgi:hypothetical protein